MFLTALFALLSQDAHAVYVTALKVYNSSYGSACEISVGSSSSSSSTTGYYVVDDIAGEYSATCMSAMLAQYFNDDVTMYYSSPYVALSSTESGNIPFFASNYATGTSSADRCGVTMSSTSGTLYGYVDDSGGEEDVMCGLLSLIHFYGSASWSVSRSGSEIAYLTAIY